jgi:hypothetical protein
MIQEYVIGELDIVSLTTPQFIISNPSCFVYYEMKITKNGNDVTAIYGGVHFDMVIDPAANIIVLSII